MISYMMVFFLFSFLFFTDQLHMVQSGRRHTNTHKYTAGKKLIATWVACVVPPGCFHIFQPRTRSQAEGAIFDPWCRFELAIVDSRALCNVCVLACMHMTSSKLLLCSACLFCVYTASSTYMVGAVAASSMLILMSFKIVTYIQSVAEFHSTELQKINTCTTHTHATETSLYTHANKHETNYVSIPISSVSP